MISCTSRRSKKSAQTGPAPVPSLRPSTEGLACTWGRLLASYGLWVARSGNVVFEGELPAGGFVAASWHATNLLVMGVHAALRPHPYRAFVPPGIRGIVMRGCLTAYGMEAVALPPDGTGNPAAGLKEMARAVRDGYGVGIAVDGPRGPARVLRPGALWLARLTGRPLVVIGAAAFPVLRTPWWDGHLVPFPYAKIGVVYGAPITIDRGAEIDEALCAQVTGALRAAEERACDLAVSLRLFR